MLEDSRRPASPMRKGWVIWAAFAILLLIGQWMLVRLVAGGSFGGAGSNPVVIGWQWGIGALAWTVVGIWSSALPLRSAYARCLGRAGSAAGAYFVAIFLCFAIGDIVSGEETTWYIMWFTLMCGPVVLALVLAAVAAVFTRRTDPVAG